MQTPKTHIFWFKSYDLILPAMAAISDLWVIMMSLRQTDVRIGIIVVDLPEKVSSYMLLDALV